MTASLALADTTAHSLTPLLARLRAGAGAETGGGSGPERPGSRVVLGIVGAPGAGKSTLAQALVSALRGRETPAAYVPLDGFHLADAELARQGLRGRKGAPETFDGWGYAALLRRLRERPDHVVYAPGFERTLEQPLAGTSAVDRQAAGVVPEGNYLMLDRPAWPPARSELDEVWFVRVPEPVRLARLHERHVRFGKSPAQARAWMDSVDEPNARLVASSAPAADLVIDLPG
jgi:pantothenate kinase